MTHLCSGILARRRRTGGTSHCWRSCRTPRSCRSTAPSMPAGSASACTLRAAAPAAGRVLLFDTFIHNFTGVFRVCTTGLASGSRAWTSDCRAISKRCELSMSCRPLVHPWEGRVPDCQCLDNSMSAGGCSATARGRGDRRYVCNSNGQQQLCGFDVVWQKRVSMAKSACVVDSTWSRAEPLCQPRDAPGDLLSAIECRGAVAEG